MTYLYYKTNVSKRISYFKSAEHCLEGGSAANEDL